MSINFVVLSSLDISHAIIPTIKSRASFLTSLLTSLCVQPDANVVKGGGLIICCELRVCARIVGVRRLGEDVR